MEPILKWAGGKRWFIKNYRELLPERIDQYIEPFFGGGAVYFSIEPKAATINDKNADLIKTYRAIRDRSDLVERYLKEYAVNHSKKRYYEVRSARPSSAYRLAAWLIYLNRTCWNGLYRVNRQGGFNVPIGTKSWVLRPGENFRSHAALLSSAKITSDDFQLVVDSAVSGDFLFVDPPYTVKHNSNGFVKYNEEVFAWSDQERLAESLRRASGRGVKFALLNAAHVSISSLYAGFEQRKISRSQVISGQASSRASFSELFIRNYR